MPCIHSFNQQNGLGAERMDSAGFRKILVLDGYSVDTVQTGQEALGLIQTHHYDFVFTDLRMPAMDGMDVVKSVKHLRPDIDVIIITGFATVETAVEGMRHGAMDYVQKPFTEGELRAFVKKAVIRQQDQRERLLRPKVQITRGSDAQDTRNGEFSIPGGVMISKGHCWSSLAQDGSVKVGMDDFAKKLIGRVDALELPRTDLTLQAGQPLFAVRQGARRIQFLAPVSGRVTKVNRDLIESKQELDVTPYHNQWICEINGENLDAEIPTLMFGKSAVALFQEDLSRFTVFVHDTAKSERSGHIPPDPLSIGAMEALTDDQWNRAAKDFFGR